MKKFVIIFVIALFLGGCSMPLETKKEDDDLTKISEAMKNCYDNPGEWYEIDVEQVHAKLIEEGFVVLEDNFRGENTYKKDIDINESINGEGFYDSYTIFFSFNSTRNIKISNCNLYLGKAYSLFIDDELYAVWETYNVETIYDREASDHKQRVEIRYRADDLYYWLGTEMYAIYNVEFDDDDNEIITEANADLITFSDSEIKTIMKNYNYEVEQFFKFNYPVVYEKTLNEQETAEVRKTLTSCLNNKEDKYELSQEEVRAYFEDLGFEVERGMDNRIHANNAGNTDYNFSLIENKGKITDCEFYVSDKTDGVTYDVFRTGYIVAKNEFRYLENISKKTSRVATAKYGFIYNVVSETIVAEELDLIHYSDTELDNEVLNTRPDNSRAVEYYEVYLEGYNKFFD